MSKGDAGALVTALRALEYLHFAVNEYLSYSPSRRDSKMGSSLDGAMRAADEAIRHCAALLHAAETPPESRTPVDDTTRCAICGWSLASLVGYGCVRGNCSQRPLPNRAYSLVRAAKEYGPTLDLTRFKNYTPPITSPPSPETAAETLIARWREASNNTRAYSKGAYWQGVAEGLSECADQLAPLVARWREEREGLQGQITEAREACPCVRQDRFADASLLGAVNEEISRSFRYQSRAEQAEATCARLEADLAAVLEPRPIATAPEATYVWVLIPNYGWHRALRTTHPSDGSVWWTCATESEIVHPTHWVPEPSAALAAARSAPQSQKEE